MSYTKNKILPLCIVYAIFTVIIILLSANLAGVAISIAHIWTQGHIPIGRDAIENDTVLSAIYIGLIFSISYMISRKYGNFFHSKIRTFDDSLKKKLAQYLLYGAIITLVVYFVLIFLRYIVTDAAILTLVYALALAISFTYLLFATFAFASNTRMEMELHHKEELMQNLQAYTEKVDSISQEMRLFKHDHLNLLLGFREHIENKHWDGLREYYEKYMTEFSESIAVKDAIVKKLSNIQIPEMNSILLAKCVQAQQQNTEIWVEVSDTVVIPNINDVLLDLCRIIGILIDNALEACKGVDGAEIRILVMNEESGSTFVLENTCHAPPPVHELFRKGFSTKGDSRGLGLFNVAQILTKNRHILLDTTAINGVFTQTLKIIS